MVATASVARHAESLECYACHAFWLPQCYRCHVKVDYGKDGDDTFSYIAHNSFVNIERAFCPPDDR